MSLSLRNFGLGGQRPAIDGLHQIYVDTNDDTVFVEIKRDI